MDKSKDHLPVMVVKQTMIIAKTATESANLLNKALRGLAVVMDVNLDITNPLPRYLRERLQCVCLLAMRHVPPRARSGR